MGNHIPIGYQISNGKIVIDRENAKTVKQIFAKYLKNKSLLQIAKDLTKNCVPNANGRTNWTHGDIIKILENTKYLGDEFLPPLIRKTLFDTVQQTRQSKMKVRTKREEEVIIKTYPKKPLKCYIPHDVFMLDEQIEGNPNDINLIMKRTELFYTHARIYDINGKDG